MANTAKSLGRNLMKVLTGRVSTAVDKAALLTLDVATDGTQEATKFITTDVNINQGVMKASAVHIGASGSETEVTATGKEINQAFELSAKSSSPEASVVMDATYNNAIVFLNKNSGLTMTLPALSTVDAGWQCRFITKTALTGNAYIITEKTGVDTDKIVTNFIAEGAVDTGANGPQNADHATITFVNGKNVVGDWVHIETDGAIWYAHGFTGGVADAITLA